VVVTLGTRERRAEKPLADRVDHVGDRFLSDTLRVGVVAMPPLAQSQHHRPFLDVPSVFRARWQRAAGFDMN
jgi:hypothetical protein